MRTINELMSLQGRRALITGANGGIGRRMAATIAELGGDLVLVDQLGTEYGALLDTLQSISDVNVACVDCNLEDGNARSELIFDLLEQEEELSILINNAAFVGSSDLEGWATEFQDQSIETWQRALEVNLTAAFDLSKGLTPKLKQSGHGSIVNVASIYGISGPDYSLYTSTQMGNPAAYSVSKGGLIQLTRWLATTLAPDIRVNTISPGGMLRNQPEVFVRRYEARTPLKRMAVEEDIKGVTAFLSSDLSAYVTGQNLLVDGGWTAW